MGGVVMDLVIAASLFVLLLAALELGFRSGRRARSDAEPGGAGQVGAIQGAVLGVLGLLLAFSFAAAGSRFLERQDMIVAEANAIGTAHLRADLLAEPHRTAMRETLRGYTKHRVEVTRVVRRSIPPEQLREVDRFHDALWRHALAGVTENPAATMAVLTPVNEVIDMHSNRIAAGKKHLPLLVLGLLIASSVLAIGVIGYGCGMAGRRRIALAIPLTLIISTALWITIDLDHPRGGFLRLSDAPLNAIRFGESPE